MKKRCVYQPNLFDRPPTEAATRLPRIIQMEPVKPLLQALLIGLLTAQRPAVEDPHRNDEVKS